MRPTSRHIAAIALIVIFLLIGQVIPAAAVTSSRATVNGKPTISNAALQEALRKAHIQTTEAGQSPSSQSLTQLASQYAQEEAILGANRSTAQESNSSSGSSTTEILALIAGVLLLAGIAFVIFRDARSVAPATGGPGDAGAGAATAAAARQRRRRTKAKAARAQRKRNR